MVTEFINIKRIYAFMHMCILRHNPCMIFKCLSVGVYALSLEIKVWKFWQATPPPPQAHTLCRRKKNCHLDIHFRFNFFRWWNTLLYRKYALLKIKHSIPIGVRPKGCWFVPRCGHLTRNAFFNSAMELWCNLITKYGIIIWLSCMKWKNTVQGD